MGQMARRVFAAVLPFLEWLDYLNEQLNETAKQVQYIVDAYDYAHRAVIHPDDIRKNRREKQEFIQMNASGHHAQTIQELENLYEMYWERDGQVMKIYRDSVSGALDGLPEWKSPPSITNTGLVAPVLSAAAHPCHLARCHRCHQVPTLEVSDSL